MRKSLHGSIKSTYLSRRRAVGSLRTHDGDAEDNVD